MNRHLDGRTKAGLKWPRRGGNVRLRIARRGGHCPIGAAAAKRAGVMVKNALHASGLWAACAR